MDYDDYESLPTNNFTTHMTAGAIAGVLEHCIMYPLDSVKTRMQSLYHKPGQSISGIFLRMIQQEGFMRPLRGLSAVVMGAGPAHAFYFASYEYTKENLSRLTHHKYNQLAYGLAGCVATLIHDGISNPTEVVKQRMQMYNSPYRSVLQCVSAVYKQEGFRAFYRSYTTQLFMNVPFQSIHFMTYEFVQNHSNPERNYNPMAHMISGAMAGAFAAAATTPLDVCKTLLNTEGKNRTMFNAMRHVYKLAGPLGYFRGMRARILYQMPAAAICWSTYEFFKYILIGDKSDSSNSPKTVSKDESSFTDNISLRLVLPQTNMEEDNSNTEGGNAVPSRSCNDVSGLKTRELPAVSGANLYGALSLNTMHSSNNTINTNTSRLRSDNTFFDMRTS